ncbi:MAG TPA: hypothetical protein VFV87_20250 [Pirellulaceae bacterium]|nr:hypothetical protein [Pirellulaceae bacterium]
MSAQSARGAEPVEDRQEEVIEEGPQSGEEARSHAERGNEGTPVEQEDTEVSEEDTVLAEAAPQSGEDGRSHAERGNEEPSELAAEARQRAAGRVREAARVPPGMRERLAALVESGGQIGADGVALVSIDEALCAVAEGLPNSVRLRGEELARPGHPGGEAFFTSAGGEVLSDERAEELARGQLARSGLLRGQRVRVAQD